MDLVTIQQVEASDSKDYFPDMEMSVEFLAICLAGKTGEACNDIKKYLRGDFDFVELSGRLRKELPDILIYLVMLADMAGINLETAYHNKKEFNDQRYRKT